MKGSQEKFQHPSQAKPSLSLRLFLAVHGVHGESGEADGDVFGAVGSGRGILDPFAFVDEAIDKGALAPFSITACPHGEYCIAANS